MPDLWNNVSTNGKSLIGTRPSKSAPCSPIKPLHPPPPQPDLFHVAHKVPVGDSPYVKAKRVQLVDKDPDRAIALFWAAINAGDRVDSALKDMAIVMKQQNRAEEAIEAIKSLRVRCSDQAQESLDNILLDLYKRCGRLDDQIALLKHKLHLIQLGLAFNGKRTKTARSQGRKFQVSVEQEATRLLGNLGWALMQLENYTEAEGAYRRALLIGPDNNKMCNLGICLMKQGRVTEAKDTLKQVRPAIADGPRGVDSHLKAFERAQEMLRDLESKLLGVGRESRAESWKFDTAAFFSSSSVWQPQPCVDFVRPPREVFADENADVNRGGGAAAKLDFSTCANIALNIDAAPFYSKQVPADPLVKLKRTRSGNVAAEKKPPLAPPPPPPLKKQLEDIKSSSSNRRRSLSLDQAERDSNKWLLDLLPDNKAFDEAIVAAVLAPVLAAADAVVLEPGVAAAAKSTPPLRERNAGKRLRVFQDITQSLSPRA